MGTVIIANNVTLLATAEFPFFLLIVAVSKCSPSSSPLASAPSVSSASSQTPASARHFQPSTHSNTFVSLMFDGFVVSCDLPNAPPTVAKRKFVLLFLHFCFCFYFVFGFV
jgi:hypothetical protein